MAFPPERAANPERGRHLSFPPPPPQPPPHLSSPPREPTPLLVRTIAPASRAPGVSDDGTWCGQLTYTSDRFCRVLVPSRFLVSFLVHPSSLCALPLPSLSPPPSSPFRFGFRGLTFVVFWGVTRGAAVKLSVHGGPRRINVCGSCEQILPLSEQDAHPLPLLALDYYFFVPARPFVGRRLMVVCIPRCSLVLSYLASCHVHVFKS